MENTNKTLGNYVMVTGANGHVGTTLTRKLLERGYRVRATVRDHTDETKTSHLIRYAKKHDVLDNLELVSLDIMDQEQFIEASKGVDGLFHVAAVFKFGLPNPEETIIKPIVDGAKHAIQAAATNGITRVVYTSSVAAMGNGGTVDHPLDDTDWNIATKVPYPIGKTRAEKESWDLAKQLGVDMVAINPSLILGPYFVKPSTSIDVVQQIVDGKMPLIPPFGFNIIDSREVAEAHIQAYERKDANGRYIIASGQPTSARALFDIMHGIDPNVKVPRFGMSKFMFVNYARITSFFAKLFGKIPQISTQQAKEYKDVDESGWFDLSRTMNDLHVVARPLEETLKDTMEWLSDQ